MKKSYLFAVVLFLFGFFFSGCKPDHRLLVSGYTKPGEEGMAVSNFNEGTGNLNLISRIDVGPDPSFFVIRKKEKWYMLFMRLWNSMAARVGDLLL